MTSVTNANAAMHNNFMKDTEGLSMSSMSSGDKGMDSSLMHGSKPR